MKESFQAWRVLQRPVFSRMPAEQEGNSYQDYPATSWLLKYWDDIFYESMTKCEDLVRQFNPLFCDPEYLDFLAPLCGWTSPYWDSAYSIASKRLLLINSNQIWSYKGTRETLSLVLNSLFIDHKIKVDGSFILGQSQFSVQELGSNQLEFEVLLPAKYLIDGYEFKLTRKIVSLFSPCWCLSIVKYE